MDECKALNMGRYEWPNKWLGHPSPADTPYHHIFSKQLPPLKHAFLGDSDPEHHPVTSGQGRGTTQFPGYLKWRSPILEK